MATKTAREVIKAALLLIKVESRFNEASASDYALAMSVLNDMISDLLILEMDVGYTAVSDLSDTVTLDSDNLYKSIQDLLALTLWPLFWQNKEVPTLIATRGISASRKIHLYCGITDEMDYPDTLPTGSGNTSLLEDTFFDSDSSEEVY